MDLAPDPVLALRDLHLTLGFTPDGSRAAGGAVAGLADTDPLDVVGAMEPGGVCDLLVAFGGSCVPCDVGRGACLEAQFAGIAFTDTPQTFPDLLPACGVDLDAVPTLPTLACDVDPNLDAIDCGCRTGAQGGIPLMWMGLAALLRRRSRA